MFYFSFSEYISSIHSSAYRYLGNTNLLSILKLYIVTIGFRYIVWMRLCSYFMSRKHFFLLYYLSILRIKHLQYRSGIQISWKTQIGPGFYIGHFGEIVVSPNAILGKNVNISQGVCIGAANRGRRKGAAIIGDCVYIAPGAKIVGAVTVGTDVCIGANAVVTSDVPDHACVGGVPAKILSYEGTVSYVENKI